MGQMKVRVTESHSWAQTHNDDTVCRLGWVNGGGKKFIADQHVAIG